jgi:argininosuccinate lyase
MITAIEGAKSTLEVLLLSVPKLTLNTEVLISAMSDDLKSVDEVNKLVMEGIPFRDAYSQVKGKLSALQSG